MLLFMASIAIIGIGAAFFTITLAVKDKKSVIIDIVDEQNRSTRI